MAKIGKFITLEGSEGAGKSTNIRFIESYLCKQGIDVVMTREPGGTPIGEMIRRILLDNNNTQMHQDTELLLMFAARAQHIHQKILPSLEQGKWVISDRFTDASFAYQGAARAMGFERIEIIEQWVQQGFSPDCTFVLDLPVEVGMQRVASRGEAKDRFETEQQTFFEKVRQGYLQRAQSAPQRYCVVDAAQALNQVQNALAKSLDRLMEK